MSDLLSSNQQCGHSLELRRDYGSGSVVCPYCLMAELETERMRLAGCGVAAMANTHETIAQRIGRDSPYWSASYGDVCRAVDREMRLREAVFKAKAELAAGHQITAAHILELASDRLGVETKVEGKPGIAPEGGAGAAALEGRGVAGKVEG